MVPLQICHIGPKTWFATMLSSTRRVFNKCLRTASSNDLRFNDEASHRYGARFSHQSTRRNSREQAIRPGQAVLWDISPGRPVLPRICQVSGRTNLPPESGPGAGLATPQKRARGTHRARGLLRESHRIRCLHGRAEEAATSSSALGTEEVVWNGQSWTGEQGSALDLTANRQNPEALRTICVTRLGPCVSRKRSPGPSSESPSRRAAKNEDRKVPRGPRGGLNLPLHPLLVSHGGRGTG